MTTTTHVGHPVVDERGEKVGTIDDVICDERSLEPRWLSIKIGMLKGHRLVPIELFEDAGDTSVVHADKQLVLEAPKPEMPGAPSRQQDTAMRDYFGLPAVEEDSPPAPGPAPRPALSAERQATRASTTTRAGGTKRASTTTRAGGTKRAGTTTRAGGTKRAGTTKRASPTKRAGTTTRGGTTTRASSTKRSSPPKRASATKRSSRQVTPGLKRP